MIGARKAAVATSGVADQARRAGESLPHPHALLLVDEEAVGLHHQVVLQFRLVEDQQLQSILGFSQAQLQGLEGVINGEHFVHQPEREGKGRGQRQQGLRGKLLGPGRAAWKAPGAEAHAGRGRLAFRFFLNRISSRCLKRC